MKYEYKGKPYMKVSKVKIKVGSLWVEGILYKSLTDQKLYVREKGEFLEKFKSIV